MGAIFVRILAMFRTVGPFIVKMFGKVKWLKSAGMWLFASESFRRTASCAIAISMFAMFKAMMDNICQEVSSLGEAGGGAGISGYSASFSGVDRSFLSKVNYVFPVDTFATVCGIYVSVWTAVFVFRWVNRLFDMSSAVYEKKPNQ